MIGNPSSHLIAKEIMSNRGEDRTRQGTETRISVERFTKRSILLFLFLILNSNSMINESGFMPDFLFSVNRYYDIIETNLTQI